MIDDKAHRAWLSAVRRRVRTARPTEELTQEKPGRATGLSRSVVSLLEYGSDVSLLGPPRVASRLGLLVVELIGPDKARSRTR